MPLFEVAVIEKPSKKEAEEGAVEKLVLAPKAVVARDSQGAAISATQGLQGLDVNKCEVLVRPFA